MADERDAQDEQIAALEEDLKEERDKVISLQNKLDEIHEREEERSLTDDAIRDALGLSWDARPEALLAEMRRLKALNK